MSIMRLYIDHDRSKNSFRGCVTQRNTTTYVTQSFRRNVAHDSTQRICERNTFRACIYSTRAIDERSYIAWRCANLRRLACDKVVATTQRTILMSIRHHAAYEASQGAIDLQPAVFVFFVFLGDFTAAFPPGNCLLLLFRPLSYTVSMRSANVTLR